MRTASTAFVALLSGTVASFAAAIPASSARSEVIPSFAGVVVSNGSTVAYTAVSTPPQFSLGSSVALTPADRFTTLVVSVEGSDLNAPGTLLYGYGGQSATLLPTGLYSVTSPAKEIAPYMLTANAKSHISVVTRVYREAGTVSLGGYLDLAHRANFDVGAFASKAGLGSPFAVGVFYVGDRQLPPISPPSASCNKGPVTDHLEGISTPASTISNLGPYSPFLSQSTEICRDVPEGWVVDQVSIISRHGARFPTSGANKRIQASLAKLANLTGPITEPSFKFAANYSFSGVKPDLLTDFGRKEMYDAGARYAQQYKSLVPGLFARSAGDQRVVESAQYFLQGMSGGAFSVSSNVSLPSPEVIISEDAGQNNTLSPSTCTADEELDPAIGDVAEANWLSVYAKPIVARLNAALPGVKLVESDIPNIMSLCGFESLRALTYKESPWCSVFSTDEWKQNEYYYDLSKFYDHSYGSPYARASGAGYANELIARLTKTPVLLGSATNSTLDTSPKTFPLNKQLYFDASHDNAMVPILATLGLWKESDLPSKPNPLAIPSHLFTVSEIVPFGGRFVFERLVHPQTHEPYLRVLVNDAVIPLPRYLPGCEANAWGLCPVKAFVEQQTYARAQPSHWDELCYGEPKGRDVPL